MRKLIDSLTHPLPQIIKKSSVQNPHMCYISHTLCQVSYVRCQMSCVRCQMSPFLKKFCWGVDVGELVGWGSITNGPSPLGLLVSFIFSSYFSPINPCIHICPNCDKYRKKWQFFPVLRSLVHNLQKLWKYLASSCDYKIAALRNSGDKSVCGSLGPPWCN